MKDLRLDLIFGLRRLRATPLFTLFAVLSLALGVGVTTAVYSVMYAMIWRAPGVSDPHGLAVVVAADAWNDRLTTNGSMARGDFDDYAAAQISFSRLAASAPFSEPFISGEVAEIVIGHAVTADFFETLGVGAAVGRLIGPADDRLDLAPAVVLGESFWRTRFDADPAIVGRPVRIGGVSFVVVGVAAAEFRGLADHANLRPDDMWIPLAAVASLPNSRAVADRADRSRHVLSVVGRLREHQALDPASAELTAFGARLDSASPWYAARLNGGDQTPSARQWSAVPFGTRLAGDGRESTMAAVLVGLVALVLVVACTNLANLTLARGAGRRRDLAVRRALGGSRGRIVRELLVENAIIALSGGLVAILVAQALLATVVSQLPVASGLPVDMDLRLNPAVLAAAAAAAIVSLGVFGVWPAWRLASVEPRSALASGGTADTIRWRARRSLIAWQVAVAAGFLLTAAFGLRSVASRLTHDSGVDVDHLGIVVMSFRAQRWDQERALRALDTIVEAAATEPGVLSAAAATGLPFSMSFNVPQASIGVPERQALSDADGINAYVVTATPAIFRTLGVSLIRGRAFDGRDNAATTPVMVVSETAAHLVFGTADPLGRAMTIRGSAGSDHHELTTVTVIGIARDTDDGQSESRRSSVVYLPIAQRYETEVFVIGRAADAVDPTLTTLRTVIRRTDPDLAVVAAAPGLAIMSGFFLVMRAAAVVATGLGALAMLLAMAGLYGVLSQLVESRTREMGIRIALGADRSRIRGLVFRDGLQPVAMGLALALGVGIIVRLLVRAHVAGAEASMIDVLTFVIAPMPLVVCAWIACYLPARRAARVDPNVALRDQ